MCRRHRLAALLVLSLLPAWPSAGIEPLDPSVTAQLQRTGEAQVLVALTPPRLQRPHDLHRRRRAIATRRATVLSSVRSDDVRVDYEFSVASAFMATVNERGLRELLAHPAVLGVQGPGSGSGALAQSVPQIRADAVHRRGDRGQGVTVAVLDSGVDPTHPDLAGSVVAEHCFCQATNENPNCCPDGTAEQSGPGSAFTTQEHGLHVTGIIVSKGIVAPEIVGVAPDAKVVVVKVLADDNRGTVSDWIKALDWIASERPDVQAINMSLATDISYSGECDGLLTTFAQVIDELRARGTLVFAASGNSGSFTQMAAPACIRQAIAVGAVAKDDQVWFTSNTAAGLDLLAPGVDIVSTGLGGTTKKLSGTSMATPHALGTAALMLAWNPDLGADQLESILKTTGVPRRDPRNNLTFPRVNALAAFAGVLKVTRPFSGGGSPITDCLAEWNVTGGQVAAVAPVLAVSCRDGDATCDRDQIAGQCTFQISVCFNVPDRRLPRCRADATISRYPFIPPDVTAPVDPIDAANRAAVLTALPPTPMVAENVCSESAAIVVPAGSVAATRSIRLYTRADDGRVDRVRLTCLPSH